MAEYRLQNLKDYPEKKVNFIYPIFFLWGSAAITILGFIWYENVFYDNKSRYYLLPWCFLTGAAIALPSVYLWLKGQFNLFNPLVYAAWSYFFPAFFIGSLILASGLSNSFYLNFVRDERNDLPLTLVYAILGYLGLSCGFLLPFGRMIGKKVGDYLPEWNWKPEQLLVPGFILLTIGFFNMVLGFIYGILGFQKVEETGVYDGLLFLTTHWGVEATLLLWLVIFRTKRLNANHYILAALLILSTIVKAAFQGNRGSLVYSFILIVFAFIYAERKITIRHKFYGAVLVTVTLLAGMIYGTTFRNVKETEEQTNMNVYTENIFETFGKLSDQDMPATVGRGFGFLAERIDSVSPMAVVVSNYEILKPYEEGYGLDNNIWKDSVTFFIPRIIWHDKPVASEPRRYADLYFNYAENSFVVTPMGDLLRNFGPVGVPLGMLFLGFLIRIVYVSLIEGREFSFWRVTLFYLLLSNILYEGFYGTIIPYVMKVGFIAVIGILLVWFFVKNRPGKNGA